MTWRKFSEIIPVSCSFRRPCFSGLPATAWLVLATGMVMSLLTPVLAASPGHLHAEIVYRDGSSKRIERLDNRSLQLETALGTLPFDYAQVARLALDLNTSNHVILDSVAGDRWVGKTSLQSLSRRLPLLGDDGNTAAVAHILFHRENPVILPASLNSRVALTDGSVIRVDASQTTLTIEHEQGQWIVPLAAADAISFAYNDDILVGAAWFSAGNHFLRGEIKAHTLSTRDQFGRTLTIPFDQIKGIRTTRPVEEAPSQAAITSAPETVAQPIWRQHESVQLRDRRTAAEHESEIATTVWMLETSVGALHLPSPLVSRISNDPLSDRALIRTITGDLFRGRLRPKTLPEHGDAQPSFAHQLTLEGLDSLRYQRQSVTAPSGWLAWRLNSGNIFYGQFIDAEIPIEQLGRRRAGSIPSSEVRGIFLNETSGTLMLETATGPYPLHARAREVDVLLAINGMQVRLPWDAVEGVYDGRIRDLPPSTAIVQDRSFLQDAVLVEDGEFMLGRLRGEGMPDEVPPVKVRIAPFIMDVAAITRSQFAVFTRETGYLTEAEQANASLTWRNPGFPQQNDEPVVFVTWYDAARFSNWRSQKAGLDAVYEFARRDNTVITHRRRNGFRLPTEAEWEFAARAGGRDQIYPWGDAGDAETLARSANFRRPDDQSAWPWTTSVKSHPPNDLGLYNMAGNVWEWCEDWYFDQAYQTVFRLQPVNPVVPANSVPGLQHRVMRGGSFQNHADLMRCASRGHGLPGQSANRVGFRLVRNAPAP